MTNNKKWETNKNGIGDLLKPCASLHRSGAVAILPERNPTAFCVARRKKRNKSGRTRRKTKTEPPGRWTHVDTPAHTKGDRTALRTEAPTGPVWRKKAQSRPYLGEWIM